MDIRPIAFYLPQYHPIPENDAWWGTGFTEWTNVTKAKPLFRGHIQPNLPADLGFYDLRVSETREAQAELARDAGIEGFCYWHYWFGGGKKLLERPLREVIESSRPNFPFCVAWANESWTGRWHGLDSKVLQKQEYPDEKDIEDHFFYLADAFADDRYIKIDGKPVFVIYNPMLLPSLEKFSDMFRELAAKNGLDGLYILGYGEPNRITPENNGLDGVILSGFDLAYQHSKSRFGKLSFQRNINRLRYLVKKGPINRFSYKAASDAWLDYPDFEFDYYPVCFPNWDNSPRCGENSIIITGSTPELFEDHLIRTSKRVLNRPKDKRVVFIKSWNEWAEGNYLEPDRRFGRGYLDAIQRVRFAR